jgi:tetratricopeptide (TPR) repeat protein
MPHENPPGGERHAYSQADLSRLFKVPRSLVGALARAHHITPAARGGKTGYTFQDLLILRTAGALKAAKVSTPHITAALDHLRAMLPRGGALTTVALAESGKDFVVRDGDAIWEAHSGQYALPLRPLTTPVVRALAATPSGSSARSAAEAHYARGHRLEDSDLAAARAAYRDALQAHGDHLDARINLGRLLHLAGDLTEAERVYRAARSSSALLSFNLAVLLDDLHREQEAMAAYREALALDPGLRDAHYNLSMLHERAQQPREALRHLLAYRRLTVRPDPK